NELKKQEIENKIKQRKTPKPIEEVHPPKPPALIREDATIGTTPIVIIPPSKIHSPPVLLQESSVNERFEDIKNLKEYRKPKFEDNSKGPVSNKRLPLLDEKRRPVFVNRLKSAKNSCISLGDMLTRLKDERYSLKDETEAYVVRFGLMYHLLRLF